MNIIDTIILGIVEGVTEFLPISSTAHLEITGRILGILSSNFTKSFEIAIQLGAIMSVLFMFRKDFLSYPSLYFKKIMIAFIPTGIVGFFLYQTVKDVFLGNIHIVAWALLLGGIVILLFEKFKKSSDDSAVSKDLADISNKQLIIMGLAQSLAVVPGVSRSLSVILSGRALGIPRVLLTEFSFLLAIPTMLFATIYDLYKSGFAFAEREWGLLAIGFIVSFLTALLVVKWLIGYIRRNSFSIFGYYRIILGLLIFWFFI